MTLEQAEAEALEAVWDHVEGTDGHLEEALDAYAEAVRATERARYTDLLETVAIFLARESYYYGGLEGEQKRVAHENLYEARELLRAAVAMGTTKGTTPAVESPERGS